MARLIFRNDKAALKNLSNAQKNVDKFLKKHPGKTNDKQHAELRKLLSKRASALSKATGTKIHSLFD